MRSSPTAVQSCSIATVAWDAINLCLSCGVPDRDAGLRGRRQFNLGKGKRKKKKAAAAPAAAPSPVVPKDAVSLGLLQKAKKLAAQLRGVKVAKQALDALARLVD